MCKTDRVRFNALMSPLPTDALPSIFQLGPGGGNLIGAREGSERVAHGLGRLYPDVFGEDAGWWDELEEGAEHDAASSNSWSCRAAAGQRADKRGGGGCKGDWRRERAGNCGNVFDGLVEECE